MTDSITIPNPVEEQKQQERDRIRNETAIEREWWKSPTKFPLECDSDNALMTGVLVGISNEGNGWRTIGRLNDKDEPTWLRPETLALINEIFTRWKTTYSIPDNILLAITSVGRNRKHQEFLTANEGGYRAAPEDTCSHLSGVAFDVSLRSYYLTNPNGERISVSTWNKNTRHTFDPQITESFLSTAQIFKNKGKCNVVVEKAIIDGEPPVDSVLHICISPNYGVNNSNNET